MPILLSGLGNASFAQNPVETATTHLQQTRSEYGLSEQDMGDLILTDHTSSKASQLDHAYFIQAHEGIPISGAYLNVNVMASGEVLSSWNSAVPDKASKVNTTQPSISQSEAIQKAFEDRNIPMPSALQLAEEANGPGKYTTFENPANSKDQVQIRLQFYPTTDGNLRLSWEVILHILSQNKLWRVNIDAVNGTTCGVENRVLQCFSQDPLHENHNCIPNPPLNLFAPPPSPNSYRVLAPPIESPLHGNRSLVPAPPHPTASPFGWHDTNGISGPDVTTTDGNNAFARSNVGVPANGGANLCFDSPMVLPAMPTMFGKAAITNAYFWVKYLHDITVGYGFDEASGNFQTTNYTGLGLDGDALIVNVDTVGFGGGATFGFSPDGLGSPINLSSFNWGQTIDFQVTTPASISDTYHLLHAPSTPIPSTIPATFNLFDANDAVAPTTDGCEILLFPPIVSGGIVFVDYPGACGSTTQVTNAENAGAAACILCNTIDGTPYWWLPAPTGNIPVFQMSKRDCDKIRPLLGAGVTASLASSNEPGIRSTALDNLVIAHEFGHGVDLRLSGGPSTLCYEFGQEGACDWLGLMMTIEPGDQGSDVRPAGAYAFLHPANGNGARATPYSTDMAVHPWTYGDITNHPAVMAGHNAASVWGNMLWEVTWALIDQYGFDPNLASGTGGNNIALALVIQSFKIQPCGASIIQSRDAVLQADQVLYNGANQCLLWRAFAKRGLGFSATSAFVNAFDVPTTCILPVTQLHFSATAQTIDIALDWEVAQEIENKGFEIERRADGETAFQQIGFVASKGNSNANVAYRYLDADVRAGVTYWYRFRQVDLNGHFEYSDVRSARIDDSNVLQLEVYPNPSAGNFTVDLCCGGSGEINMRLYDFLGKELLSKTVAAETGSTIVEWDVSDIPVGQYLLEVRQGNGRVSKRVVKQ